METHKTVDSYDLSVIITAHAEGLLAHKTLLSALRALEELKNDYQIIVNIDRGDEATIDYFKRYRNDSRFVILKTDFGDLGLSRNYALKKSNGKLVAFLDADDMVSRNWFKNAIEHIESANHPVVVHPKANYIFGFDTPPTFCYFRDSKDLATDMLIMLGANRWISAAVAKREIFEETPYMPTKNGFGHEDYFFNMQTLAKGVKHETAKNTVYFYRRKPNSLMDSSNTTHVTQPYTDLFDLKKLQALPPVTLQRRLTLEDQAPPEYVQTALRDINSIDTEVQLTPEIKAHGLPIFDPDTNNARVPQAFQSIIKNVDRLPDYVFLVPWIVPGGADKVLINYIEALKQLHPSWRIAVISTLPSENSWASKLPDNAYHLDFGNNIDKLNDSEKEIVFTRLLIQLKCSRLHLINSEFAYRWVVSHQELIKHNFRLDVSVFSYVKTEHGFEYSYVDPCLREIYPVVHRIFTDNQTVIDQAVARNGFDPDRFKIHYQPACFSSQLEYPPEDQKPHSPFRILWASRVDSSKCPELLIQIAKRLDPKNFQIDVYGRLDPAYDANIFKSIPALTYHGDYAGFASLPTNDFDLFLYTSRADGLPNVLLEATAAGLPIVASDVGGISDFVIDQETGFLVKTPEGAEKYIEKIEFVAAHSSNFRKIIKNAQKLLVSRHGADAFIENIRPDF
ncbi:glycosyltransferase [Candidatus Saccharibacteria bacterium]|nr:glycosyltransferase [Candidatus Saccharibacteria bacterium]MBQ3467951.1 glycosyltransferase [Candidatus Saccharibacteria bacterium]